MTNTFNVVLRTCDRVSLNNDRLVDKKECIIRCVKSLYDSLINSNINFRLYVIDDNSSMETQDILKQICLFNTEFNLLPEREQSELNNKQKSRYSIGVAYDYILSLDENELVYIVEDDYLHYPDSIEKMLEAYRYFTSYIPDVNIGIFPQDFTELYPHPQNKFNDTYVKPCIVFPGPDRYYRSTWFTHESFLIPISVIHKHKDDFLRLLDIGNNDYDWEGSTISNVWEKPDVLMLMPIMRTLAIHVSKKTDIPFYNNDFDNLWQINKF